MLSKEIQNTLRPFIKGLPLTILLVIIGVWIAGKYATYVTPVYESTAKIKLADNIQGPTASKLYDDFDYFASENKISAEIELIKSNSILEKVVESLPSEYIIYRVGDIHSTELYDQSPLQIFSVIQDSTLIDKAFQLKVSGGDYQLIAPDEKIFTAKLGKSVSVKGSEILITLNRELLSTRPGMKIDDNYRFVFRSKGKLISEIRSNLDVMAVDKDVPVIRISYKSPIPQKAHDIVNLVAELYIRDYEETKYITADTTVTFLDKQLKQYAEKLQGSESDIEDYRNTKNIINIRQETETDLRKISDLKKQLSNFRMNLAAIDTLDKYIHQSDDKFMTLAPNFEAFNDLLSTELVKKIKSFQAEKKELLIKFSQDHERVKNIDENIKEIIVYLKESISNTRKSTQVKLNELEQEIADAEEKFVGLASKERTLGGLERENQLNESIFRFLHEKKTDAEIARAAKMSFHRIIDYGDIPTKASSPNPGLLKVLAGFLCFLFGTLLSFLIFKNRFPIGDEEFIQKRTLIPFVKAIPYLENKVAEQLFFAKWASVLWLNQYFQVGKVLSFTSMKDGCHRDYIVDRLAAALTRMGKKTLVIYANNSIKYDKSGIRYDSVSLKNCVNDDLSWKQDEFENYDCVLCDAGSLELEENTFLILAASYCNILVMDSLVSKGNEVDQVNEIKETIPDLRLELLLNRTSYYPSLFKKDKVLFFFQNKLNRNAEKSLVR
jgi:uncharacterized protein involved in exopolysaccharide biosynthesis